MMNVGTKVSCQNMSSVQLEELKAGKYQGMSVFHQMSSAVASSLISLSSFPTPLLLHPNFKLITVDRLIS